MKKIIFSLFALLLFALPAQGQSFQYVDVDVPAGITVTEGPLFGDRDTHAMFFANPQGVTQVTAMFEVSDDSMEELYRDVLEDVREMMRPTIEVQRNSNIFRVVESGTVRRDITMFGNIEVTLVYANGLDATAQAISQSIFANMQKKYGNPMR